MGLMNRNETMYEFPMAEEANKKKLVSGHIFGMNEKSSEILKLELEIACEIF